MPESSEDKTKRNYLKLLNDYHWSHQYTVFYEDPESSIHLLSDMVGFKNALRRKYPDTAFLIRIQLHRRRFDHEPSQLQAILVILASSELKNLDVAWWVQRYFSYSITVKKRKISDAKLSSISSAIDTQAPHNLHKFFKETTTPIKRYTSLNRQKFVPKLIQATDQEDVLV